MAIRKILQFYSAAYISWFGSRLAQKHPASIRFQQNGYKLLQVTECFFCLIQFNWLKWKKFFFFNFEILLTSSQCRMSKHGRTMGNALLPVQEDKRKFFVGLQLNDVRLREPHFWSLNFIDGLSSLIDHCKTTGMDIERKWIELRFTVKRVWLGVERKFRHRITWSVIPGTYYW